MSSVGQREIRTQKRVIAFLRSALGYAYLGHWKDRDRVGQDSRDNRSPKGPFSVCRPQHAYQDELRLQGTRPSVVRPATRGQRLCRAVRAHAQGAAWLQRFETIEELLEALRAFMKRYNEHWLIERHGWISPAEKYK